jgi:virginiamycin B lyase
VLVVVVSSLVTGSVARVTGASASASAAACPSVQFVGVRGSGENVPHSYGATIQDIWNQIQTNDPLAAGKPIDYPAVGIGYGGWNHYPVNYQNSVATGIANLENYLTTFMNGRCADTTPLLLVGYSQGADVVGDTIQDGLTSATLARIAGVALLGDPRFKANQSIDVGDYDPSENGVLVHLGVGARKIPLALHTGTRSYCQLGDPVCNFSLTNLQFCKSQPTECPHVHYLDWYYQSTTYTTAAATFLESRYAPPQPIFTDHPDPGIESPLGIAAGSDGALWFTNQSGNSIGRITTSGIITYYTGRKVLGPGAITAGPDGALWFTTQRGININSGGAIGRITTSGTITYYTDPTIPDPFAITTGSDGALWFTSEVGHAIGRIATSGTITNFTNPDFSLLFDITAGPDGALWFVNAEGTSGDSIGRITTSGAVTFFPIPKGYPQSITAGPDGALWFTNWDTNSIGRITTSGTVTTYSDPTIDLPQGITRGPDGALWFANLGQTSGSIGRITTSGRVTNYPVSTDRPENITTGSDGALWFTNYFGHSIGQITLP